MNPLNYKQSDPPDTVVYSCFFFLRLILLLFLRTLFVLLPDENTRQWELGCGSIVAAS